MTEQEFTDRVHACVEELNDLMRNSDANMQVELEIESFPQLGMRSEHRLHAEVHKVFRKSQARVKGLCPPSGGL